MTEPPADDDGLAGILGVTGDILGQATALRTFASPPADAGPHPVHEALVGARSRLDQLEVLLGRAMDLKHASVMEAVRLEQAAEDAWDVLADNARRQGLRDQYEGAQERYATWRLRTREERAAARYARQVADVCSVCEAKVRLLYRGLDNARQDLHVRLRALAFETVLDRS